MVWLIARENIFLQEKALAQPYQILRILHPRCFQRGMHGELGKSDIRRRNGYVRGGDVAQRRASRHIGPVCKILAGYALFLTDISHHRRRIGICGIFLAALELQDNAAV